MASIVYQTRNGRRYAYSSESYWDKEKKAPRAKLTYLGPVDETTGEILTNYRERKRQEKEARKQTGDEKDQVIANLQNSIRMQSERIADLEKENKELHTTCAKLERKLSQVAAIVAV